MAERLQWAPVRHPKNRENAWQVLTSLLDEADAGHPSPMADTVVIDTRGGRQVIEFRSERNAYRLHLRADAPPVETRRVGERAQHREIGLDEIVAIEHTCLEPRA